MKTLSLALLSLLTASVATAAPVLEAWTPIFKGIDFARGTNSASYAGRQAVFALRVDLTDPDVQVFTTPALTNNYLMGSRETAAQKPAEFLEAYGLKVAVNCAHFTPGAYDMASGTPVLVHGLLMSQGRVVSAQDTVEDALSTMLFTSNKVATFIPYHYVPGTNTAGFYNAFTGMYPLLVNGVSVYGPGDIGANPHDGGEPRTAVGLSSDRRYCYLLVIDGRQGSYSTGSADYETADWLLRCGAWDGMNCDGGGSSAMVMANNCGDAVELNHNSAQAAVGRPGFERSVGGCLGFSSKALPLTFIYEPRIVPGKGMAALSWLTTAPASTRVEYGRTASLGTYSPLDPTLRTDHTAVLSNLVSGVSNYFRLISVAGGQSNSTPICSFVTLTNPPLLSTNTVVSNLFQVTNLWRFTADNLDYTGWQNTGYSDSGWSGPARGGFYVEDDVSGVPFRNTPLPTPCGVEGAPCPSGIPTTFYYRTHFTFPTSPSGTTLIFSNYVDDGAVYYLNGTEIYRLHMAPAPAVILNATLSTGYSSSNAPCSGDACVPEIFALAGAIVNTNLRQGDNVLAVESHNYKLASYDAFFACALSYSKSPPATTNQLLVLSAEPANGVPIQATPGDAYGASNNVTPLEFYYTPGAIVTLTAPTSAGTTVFARWEVDGVVFSTNTSMTLNLDTNRVVRAVYGAAPPRTLTISSTSPASGVPIGVTPTDQNGLGDGLTPFQRTYLQGATVVLVAPTNAGLNQFVNWMVDGTNYSPEPSITLTVGANRSVQAVYVPLTTWVLTVASTNPASGVAISLAPPDQNGLADGTTSFQRVYPLGAPATLTAPTDLGTNLFLKWRVDGVDVSSNASITVAGDTNHAALAVYRVRTRTLTVTSLNPTNGVRIDVNPADQNGQGGISSTPFTRVYPVGTPVSLYPSPTVPGAKFQKWLTNGVDFSTILSISNLLLNDITITAAYTNIPPGPAALTIRSQGTNVVLSWTNPAYALQYATNLAKPTFWTNVAGAATNSPYTNPATSPQRFFQLKW